MGVDDANEGPEPGECPAHEWALVEVVASGDGSHVEQECARCGAVVMVGPEELGGWV